MDNESFEFARTDTWPLYSSICTKNNNEIAILIGKISGGILEEIGKVMNNSLVDVTGTIISQNCAGIGHVVLIAICSAIDTMAAFSNGSDKNDNKVRFTSFIAKFFQDKYHGKEGAIYTVFRCDSVHGWNLHKSTISGVKNDSKHLTDELGVIYLSLYDLFDDFKMAVNKYIADFKTSTDLKNNFLKRYKKIKNNSISNSTVRTISMSNNKLSGCDREENN